MPRALELVVIGEGEGGESHRVPGTEGPAVQPEEGAPVIVGTGADIRQHAPFVLGTRGGDGDHAAGGRRGGAVHVGGALVDGGPADDFGIGDLVGVDGVIAGVIQRHAVPGEGNVVSVIAMDADVAAGIAIGIVVGEVVARHLVQGFEDRLAGGLTVDEFLCDDGALLGHGDRRHDSARTIGLGADGDGIFHRLGGGGLGQGGGCAQQYEERADTRHQKSGQFGHKCPHV